MINVAWGLSVGRLEEETHYCVLEAEVKSFVLGTLPNLQGTLLWVLGTWQRRDRFLMVKCRIAWQPPNGLPGTKEVKCSPVKSR